MFNSPRLLKNTTYENMGSGESSKTIKNGEQCHYFRLPSELKEEILSTLSVKELLLSRSVCKSWKSLIDSSGFKNKLFEAAKNSASTLLIWRNSIEPTLHFCYPHSLNNDSYEVSLNLGQFLDESAFNSCGIMISSESVNNNLCFKKFGVINGIVCFGWNSFHVVWNPFTKEFKRFCAPNKNWFFDLLDDSDSRVDDDVVVQKDEICAFGYDPISEDYKFLIANFTSELSNSENKKMIKVLYQLYSVRNNSWKGVAVDFPVVSQIITGDGYMNDGRFFWFAKKCGDDLSPAVLVFDFRTEVFDWMPLGGELACGVDAVAVGNRGCLEIIMTLENGGSGEDKRGEIWGMGDDGSWSRKLTVILPSNVGRPVGVLKEGELMFEAPRPLVGLNELLLINPATGLCENLGFAGTQLWAFNYVQSLFSLKL